MVKNEFSIIYLVIFSNFHWRKRERKEMDGGKREKKMEKCVFGMERKKEGREK